MEEGTKKKMQSCVKNWIKTLINTEVIIGCYNQVNYFTNAEFNGIICPLLWNDNIYLENML